MRKSHGNRPASRSTRATNTACSAEPLERRALLAGTPFRPPSVPLITSDPYLSVWSDATNLTDTGTVSWTGAAQSLVSLIRVDGVSYRLIGNDPATLPAFPQVDVTVLPTRSIYDFDNGHVAVTITFLQPALGSDLNALSLPLSYINWQVSSDDGATHSVQVYDSTSSQLAVNNTSQVVSWQRGTAGGLTTLDAGTTAQTYFVPAGDQVNIDWGYVYAAASASQSTSSIGGDAAEINTFTSTGALTNTDDANVPRAVSNNQPVLAYAFNLGNVTAVAVQRHVIVAYNEVYSVNYFGERLAPYWARNGTTVAQVLTQAQANYPLYSAECAAFDAQLMDDMTAQGGSQYATLGALSYREGFAGYGLAADPNGQPLLFTKENTSNGDIATVDVIFPAFPQLLLFSPTLAKAALQSILDYSSSSQWAYPYAPHDLGTYPNAIGDPSGSDGNEQMPVEESANMLIMLDALAQETHSTALVTQYWSLVSGWASYLQPYAYTPGNQLTTNDFLGTLTNSTNLAVKAIVALGAYANLSTMLGDTAIAASYTGMAQADVTHWMAQSISADGTHWLFEYGDQGTGVQLFNLAFDSILGLNLFPASVAALDVGYAQSVIPQDPYGVPIASVTNRTSVEWSVWEASLATSPADFRTLISPIYNYLNTTTARLPASDVHTDNGNGPTSSFAHARVVMGGVFVEMLKNPALYAKYAGQDTATPGTYAGFPVKSIITPSAEETPLNWQYTTATPPAGWQQPGFDASSWSTGKGGFGSAGTPGVVLNTTWTAPSLYLVRTFVVPPGTFANPVFEVFHDEDVNLYLNGVPAATEAGYTTSYEDLAINPAAAAQLVPGQTVTLAVQCVNTAGGQGVDVGVVNIGPGAGPSHAVAAAAATGLTVAAGQSVALAPSASPTVFSLGSLSIAGSPDAWLGRLDLTDNDLIVQNGNLAQLTNQVAAGRSGGQGITSSTAAADPSHLAAIGVALNADATGRPLFGTAAALGPFDGQSPAASDVLVRYTIAGDANLDGKVDGQDYVRLDAGYAGHLTGWANGDFNYDGKVDGSDYTLIDNAFNLQPRATAQPAAVVAVPPMSPAKATAALSSTVANAVLLQSTTAPPTLVAAAPIAPQTDRLDALTAVDDFVTNRP